MVNARIAAKAGLSLLLSFNMCATAIPCVALADETADAQAEVGNQSEAAPEAPAQEAASSADASEALADAAAEAPATSENSDSTGEVLGDSSAAASAAAPVDPAEEGMAGQLGADVPDVPDAGADAAKTAEASASPDASGQVAAQEGVAVQDVPAWDASAALSAAEVSVGESVTVRPSVSGDAGDVSFNYVWQRDGWAEWDSNVKETSTFTSDASFTFSPSTPGTYTVYVDVKQASTGEVKTVEAGAVVVKARAWQASASMSGGPYAVGSAVTVTPAVSGAAGAVTYNYVWERDGWAEWGSNVKDAGVPTTDGSYRFVPDKPGTYTFYVDVTDTGTGAKVTLAAGTVVVPEGSWTAGASVSSDSCTVGGTVTVKPSVSGAAGSLEFNYVWERDGWAEWDSTVKSTGGYTSASTFDFAPTKSGTYQLYVDIVDGASGQVKTVSAGSVKVVEGSWSAAVSISSDTVNVGDTVTVCPSISTESTAGFTYNYVWQRDDWADWGSTVKDTGKATSATTWDFSPSAAGTYTLYIDVISPSGVKQTVSKSVVVGERASVKASASVSAAQIDLGKSLTVTPSVEGASADSIAYNYVWQRDGWAEWGSTVRDGGAYTAEASYTFTPQNPGTYHLYVDVVVSGKVATTVDAGEVQVKGDWTATALTVTNASSVQAGGTVQLQVEVAGETSGLQYNFVWQRDGWADWGSTLNNGTGRVSSTTYSWKLPDDTPGRYTFYVDVYDPATGRTQTLESADVVIAHDWSSSLAGKTFEWMEAAHYTEGRLGNDWDTVVIHISESSTQSSVDSTFTNGERQASAHFSVFGDSIHQYVQDFDTAWAVGNWEANTTTLSIEFVGTTENPPSKATMDTGAQLIATLCAYKGWTSIGLGNHIGVHKDYSATDCPSTTDVPYIVDRAQQYLKEILGR